jgi:hypothetical protein
MDEENKKQLDFIRYTLILMKEKIEEIIESIDKLR